MRNRRNNETNNAHQAIIPVTSTTSREDAELSTTARLMALSLAESRDDRRITNEDLTPSMVRKFVSKGKDLPSSVIKRVLTLLVGDFFSPGTSREDPANQTSSAPLATPRLGRGSP